MSDRLQDNDDDELLGRMRSGDEKAFITIYGRRQGGIYRFALQMSGSETVAEDVTQEVFLALIRESFGYQPERGTLSAYLYGIARKQLARHRERDRTDIPLEAGDESEEISLPAASADVLADLTHRESIEALRLAVLSLPCRYREVVVLCDLQEIDYAEAAQVLGCAVGTVRSRLHRARALLMEKLNRGGVAGPAVEKFLPAKCVI